MASARIACSDRGAVNRNGDISQRRVAMAVESTMAKGMMRMAWEVILSRTPPSRAGI